MLITKASSLSDLLAKWSIVLSQYDIRYTLAKGVKGQALADFLAEHLLPEDSPFNNELPNEPSYLVDWASELEKEDHWGMNFDGASRMNKLGEPTSGVGAMFYSGKNVHSILLSLDGTMIKQYG